MYTDKGYNSAANWTLLRLYGYVDYISAPGRRTHRVVNRRRNVVERTFTWLDKSRMLLFAAIGRAELLFPRLLGRTPWLDPIRLSRTAGTRPGTRVTPQDGQRRFE